MTKMTKSTKIKKILLYKKTKLSLPIFLSFLFIFLIFVITFPYYVAFASGIQVSPSKLEFNMALDGLMAKQIIVSNPTNQAQMFQVYAEDYPDLITAEPNDFALEPGGRKNVSIIVNSQKLPGSLKTQLAVLAGPLPGKKNLAVSAGVKIPLSISTNYPHMQPKVEQWFLIPLGLMTVAGIIIFRKLKKQ
jgi:P pilus assembly chaperone PapD